MSRDAAAAGISRAMIDSAFTGLTPDGAVLAFDRGQRGTFRKSLEDYAATRVVCSATPPCSRVSSANLASQSRYSWRSGR
jgi:hypothetical protein